MKIFTFTEDRYHGVTQFPHLAFNVLVAVIVRSCHHALSNSVLIYHPEITALKCPTGTACNAGDTKLFHLGLISCSFPLPARFAEPPHNEAFRDTGTEIARINLIRKVRIRIHQYHFNAVFTISLNQRIMFAPKCANIG
ncbi:hypothetical protein D3C78_1314070 [compost metagenome]